MFRRLSGSLRPRYIAGAAFPTDLLCSFRRVTPNLNKSNAEDRLPELGQRNPPHLLWRIVVDPVVWDLARCLHRKLDPGRDGVLPARRGVHMNLNKQERQCKRLTLLSIADGCSGVNADCPGRGGIHEDLNKEGQQSTEERQERTLIIFAVTNAKKQCPKTVTLVVSSHVRMESFQPDGGIHVNLNRQEEVQQFAKTLSLQTKPHKPNYTICDHPINSYELLYIP